MILVRPISRQHDYRNATIMLPDRGAGWNFDATGRLRTFELPTATSPARPGPADHGAPEIVALIATTTSKTAEAQARGRPKLSRKAKRKKQEPEKPSLYRPRNSPRPARKRLAPGGEMFFTAPPCQPHRPGQRPKRTLKGFFLYMSRPKAQFGWRLLSAPSNSPNYP